MGEIEEDDLIYIKEQFTKSAWPKRPDTYRNVVLHSSIIESLIETESKRNGFTAGLITLLSIRKISIKDLIMLNKIRGLRNKIVHGFFKKGIRERMNKNIHSLAMAIITTYRDSDFLKNQFIKKYKLEDELISGLEWLKKQKIT